MKHIATRPEGPLPWIENNNQVRIEAFFDSRGHGESIPEGEQEIPEPGQPRPLGHGFDDQLPDAELGVEQAQTAAGFAEGNVWCRAWNPAISTLRCPGGAPSATTSRQRPTSPFAQVRLVKDTGSAERRNGGAEPPRGPRTAVAGDDFRLYSSRWSGPL